MNWDELWQRFTSSKRLRPATLQAYHKSLQSFLLAFPQLREPRDVQTQHLRDFFATEQERLSLHSATSKVRVVSILLRWAYRQDLLACDPCEGFVLQRCPAVVMPILTEAQVAQLLEAPARAKHHFIRSRDRAILEVLYGCGLRLGELLGLEMGHVDLGHEVLTIRQSKGRPRLVPMGKAAAQALERYLLDFRPAKATRGQSAVWLNAWGGQPLESSELQNQLRRYGRKLGIDGITAHALRRACATHLLEHGADIVDIQALLGHADINSTLSYAQVLPVELGKTHQRSHPRARSLR